MWTNSNSDPRNVNTNDHWQGISKYVVEKTPVTQFPFVTNFNVGNGNKFFQNGQRVTNKSFNNRSIQDVMPTYRWILDNGKGNQLKANISYKDAFNGGSSVELAGQMKENVASYLKLYASDLNVTGNETANVVVKNVRNLELVVDTEGSETPTTLVANSYDQINGWSKYGFDLSKLKGKKITSIGLNVYGNAGEQVINIGSLELSNNQQTDAVSKVTGLKVAGKTVTDDITESVRLTWDKGNTATHGYNVYKKSDGQIRFAGTTSNNALTIQNEKRSNGTVISYIVVPKDIYGNEYNDKSASVDYNFSQLAKPVVSMNASSTFVKVGENVDLNAKVSPSTEKVVWDVPGGEITSEGYRTASVKFAKPGKYSITMRASNAAGVTEETKTDYITVYDENAGYSVENLTGLDGVKAIAGSGYTNENEDYSHGLDGDLTTKWCDNASDNPYMVVDLGSKMTLTGFELYNAATGGESSDWNTKDYDILVSNDNENWTPIVEHRNNTADISKDAISKTEARYVKLSLLSAEQNGRTARIYDFKILGVNRVDL